MLEGAKRRASMCWLTKVFSYSREIYRSGQEQFSSAQRAQRKFRMEPGRSAAKLARS
mgnify:CR=1 FL=1